MLKVKNILIALAFFVSAIFSSSYGMKTNFEEVDPILNSIRNLKETFVIKTNEKQTPTELVLNLKIENPRELARKFYRQIKRKIYELTPGNDTPEEDDPFSLNFFTPPEKSRSEIILAALKLVPDIFSGFYKTDFKDLLDLLKEIEDESTNYYIKKISNGLSFGFKIDFLPNNETNLITLHDGEKFTETFTAIDYVELTKVLYKLYLKSKTVNDNKWAN